MSRDETVKSLVRALVAITNFNAEHPAHTISTFAQKSGLTRSSSRRILHTLVATGYATESNGSYSLTPRLLRVGLSIAGGKSLSQVVSAHLTILSEELGELSVAAVLVEERATFLAQSASRKTMRVSLPVGLITGVKSGAFEQALRAEPDPHNVWFHEDDPTTGLCTAAVQVRGRGGIVQLSIGYVLTGPPGEQQRVQLEDALRRRATEIERDLAHMVQLDPRIEADQE